MKVTLIAALSMGAWCLMAGAPAMAQTTASREAKVEKRTAKKDKKGAEHTPAAAEDTSAAAEETELGRRLGQIPLLMQGKPDTRARVYFIYQSRSTCSICVSVEPMITRVYNTRFKGKGAELMMVNLDQSDDAARKWAKGAGMNFPICSAKNGAMVPFPFAFDGQPVTLPCMVALDAAGNKLGQASGPKVVPFMQSWHKLLAEDSPEAKLPALPLQLRDHEPVQPKGKINTEAKVYFLLMASPTDPELTRELAPALSKVYKSMKGKKAELVIVSSGFKADSATQWVKQDKIAFPVLHPRYTADLSANLFASAGGTEMALLVLDAEGNRLRERASSAEEILRQVKDWKKIVREVEANEKKTAGKGE